MIKVDYVSTGCYHYGRKSNNSSLLVYTTHIGCVLSSYRQNTIIPLHPIIWITILIMRCSYKAHGLLGKGSNDEKHWREVTNRVESEVCI